MKNEYTYNSLTREEKKIYDSVMESFPATSHEAAYNVAIQGGVRFQLSLNDMKCPCLIADKPCHPRCTCKYPMSSVGCACCATYGSKEQRKNAANRIVEICSAINKNEK